MLSTTVGQLQNSRTQYARIPAYVWRPCVAVLHEVLRLSLHDRRNLQQHLNRFKINQASSRQKSSD